jgi:hypothetical protein
VTTVIYECKIFLKSTVGGSESFFDEKEFQIIGKSGIYGDAAPNIHDPTTQVRKICSCDVTKNPDLGSLAEGEGSVRLTSFRLDQLDQLLFVFEQFFTFVTKKATLMMNSTLPSLTLHC